VEHTINMVELGKSLSRNNAPKPVVWLGKGSVPILSVMPANSSSLWCMCISL